MSKNVFLGFAFVLFAAAAGCSSKDTSKVPPCGNACAGVTPVCDEATNTCVTCTPTQGCSGAKPVCDVSVPSGVCVGCRDDGDCSAATPACDGATGFCVACTATTGCSGATPVCDVAVSGGVCVACLDDGDCPSATPACNTTNECVVCTASYGCSGATPVCKTGGGTPACVGCLSNGDCSGATPACDQTANACVTCTSTFGCSGAAPRCLVQGAARTCVECLTNGDCSGTTPVCGAGHTCNPDSSVQIAAVRGTPDGTVSLPIQGALVTYLKPALGNDPRGFFVQAEQAGPALFVAVDPATLSPAAAVGDEVSFTVTSLTTLNGVKLANMITSYARLSAGNSVTPLVQDLSAATDLVTNLGTYESEIVRLTGTLGAFVSSGAGHVAAPFATAGVSSSSLTLRLPTTLQSSLELGAGCAVTLERGPMWRYNAVAEPSAYDAVDLTGIDCPAPKVVSASALSPTSVRVMLDQTVDASSVAGSGSQFTFSSGLTASAASASGKEISVTTSTQSAGMTYTVTVASTVLDTLGKGVDPGSNTATFTGASAGCQPSAVVISQLYGGGGLTGAVYKNDFVELHNRSRFAVDMTGKSLQYSSATGTTWLVSPLSGSIPAGGYFLVQEAAGTGVGADLPTPDLVPSLIFNMSSSSGKVALVQSATALAGACPVSGEIMDLVGYGSANCSETAPAPLLSAILSAQRAGYGCIDTDDNAADFVAQSPAPRNGSSVATGCGCD